MFKNISKSFSSLDDEDRPFASLQAIPRNSSESDFERYYKELVYPHKEAILERFHLDRFEIVQDLAFHFFDIYPDGEVSLFEFIFFQLKTKRGSVRLWRHVFSILVEHTDDMGRFQKKRRNISTTVRNHYDGTGLKIKEEKDDNCQNEPLQFHTLNFFQMLNLYLFSNLRSEKESYRFLFFFLAIPDIGGKQIQELEEETEGEIDPGGENPNNNVIIKSKVLRYDDIEDVTVDNLELLIAIRRQRVNLDNNLCNILGLQRRKKKEYSDRELSQLFIQKLVQKYGTSSSEYDTDKIERIDKKSFKKALLSMKEYKSFLAKCVEIRSASFVNFTPSVESLKSRVHTEDEVNKRENLKKVDDILQYVTIVRESDISPKGIEIEDRFLHYTYMHLSKFLQFRLYKHPCELEFYQCDVMKLPSKFKFLFRKFYGRFTFFNRMECAAYYLAFLRHRNQNPKIRVERNVLMNFSKKKFWFDKRGHRVQIKAEAILQKLVQELPLKYVLTVVHSLNEELKKLLDFVRVTRYNFDQCWLKIDLLTEDLGDNKKNYLLDLYFDDTKHMSSQPKSEKFVLRIKFLTQKCEKMLKQK